MINLLTWVQRFTDFFFTNSRHFHHFPQRLNLSRGHFIAGMKHGIVAYENLCQQTVPIIIEQARSFLMLKSSLCWHVYTSRDSKTPEQNGKFYREQQKIHQQLVTWVSLLLIRLTWTKLPASSRPSRSWTSHNIQSM